MTSLLGMLDPSEPKLFPIFSHTCSSVCLGFPSAHSSPFRRLDDSAPIRRSNRARPERRMTAQNAVGLPNIGRAVAGPWLKTTWCWDFHLVTWMHDKQMFSGFFFHFNNQQSFFFSERECVRLLNVANYFPSTSHVAPRNEYHRVSPSSRRKMILRLWIFLLSWNEKRVCSSYVNRYEFFCVVWAFP